MAQPPKYMRGKNFTDDFSHETDHSALNAELDKASNSINDIRFNLAILQADDGRLRSDVVTYDSLDTRIVRDISGAVRADVQGELDRAEAAAVKAEFEADKTESIFNDVSQKLQQAETGAASSSKSAMLAHAWAQNPENIEPDSIHYPDEYSAYNWAMKAKADAENASKDANRAENAASQVENWPQSIPLGGITGQALVKKSDADWDAEWQGISGVPVGMIMPWGGRSDAVPAGYLNLNHAENTVIPANAFPKLTETVYCGDEYNATADFFYRCDNPDGTGRNNEGAYLSLPAGAKYFIRGRDPSGTQHSYKYQGDAIRNLTGSLQINGANGTLQHAGTGIFSSNNPGQAGAVATSPTVYANQHLTFRASDIVPTAAENRPINFPVCWVIKAWDEATGTGELDVQALVNEWISLSGEKANTTDVPALASNAGMPSGRYIDFVLPASEGTYTAPEAGWVYVSKSVSDISQHFYMLIPNKDGNVLIATGGMIAVAATGQGIVCYLPVKQGDTIKFRYSASGQTNHCRFIYANGVPA